MFKPNFLVLSRIFIILVGMIKAGYSFMLMSNYTNTLFYKYTGTFFAGYILTLSFYKLISRNLILLFAEFLYILMMIIIPFSSNDFRIYGYLFSGGFCFLLYPFYFNENLLKCDQRKSTILSWIFMGLGAIYFFWLTYHYQPKYNFDTNVWTILNILSQSDEITPYVFGSFSVLNILLIIFQKGKETISFYRLKQDKEKIVELSSFLYKKTYIDKIEQEFNIDDVESTNSLLLYDNNNQNEINKKEKQKFLIQMFSIAFLIGFQYPFDGLISNIMPFFEIIQDEQDYMYLKVNFGYCLSYQFVILAVVLVSIYLISEKRKVVLFISLVIVQITNFIFLIYFIKDITSDFDYNVYNWSCLIRLLFNFGVIGSMIFTQPFLVLKIHEILIYFMFLWIGQMLQHVFVQNSYEINDQLKKNYPPEILSILANFIVMIPLAYLKHF